MRDGQSTAQYTEADAITAALKQDWELATLINTQLLKQDESNVGSLNRLGYAYLKTGELTKAKKLFQKVLSLDPYNQIAQKNSKILPLVSTKKPIVNNKKYISSLMFIEDPGKTKIAACINTATTEVLSHIYPGQEVLLKAKNHCVEVRSEEQAYLAALPDDLSFKLIKLLEGGNTYQVLVKSVGKNELSVIIRELTRGKQYAHQPSFVSVSSTYSALSGTIPKSGDKPDTTTTGESDEEETSDVSDPV